MASCKSGDYQFYFDGVYNTYPSFLTPDIVAHTVTVANTTNPVNARLFKIEMKLTSAPGIF